MKALLIIDMQKGSFKPETPRYDAAGVVRRINLLSEYFRRKGDQVIFIQHDGTKENSYIPGTSDWEILPGLVRTPGDCVVAKTANDAFYETCLDTLLNNSGINELYITGCATDFCVNATVHSALVKDYNIIVVKDGHTTADRPLLSAEKVIQYHDWLWEGLTPTKGRIRLLSAAEVVGAPLKDR